jgi:hypothetical protein
MYGLMECNNKWNEMIEMNHSEIIKGITYIKIKIIILSPFLEWNSLYFCIVLKSQIMAYKIKEFRKVAFNMSAPHHSLIKDLDISLQEQGVRCLSE